MAGAVRGVVLIALSVLSLKLAVWLVDGSDPSSDADIGIGLVPIGVAALVALIWAFVDARRHPSRVVGALWVSAAALCGLAIFVRALDSIGDAVLLGCFAAAGIAGCAGLGALISASCMSSRRKRAAPAGR